MVKEFVLIERRENNRLKDNPSNNVSSENKIVSDTTPGSSMLSTQHLLSAVKNKVGTMHHNKVDQLFKFLKSRPSILTWTDFGKAIAKGIHYQELMFMKCKIIYFTIGENFQNNLHHNAWKS